MISLKNIIRIFVWSFLTLCILSFTFLCFFGDINKLKNSAEKYLREELKCNIKLGDLDWDWDGLKLGVTTTKISIFDNENNIILQGGRTRFVWYLKNIITGTFSHFYSIESTDLYLNAIRCKDGIWNFIKIFPPGPPPTADNLELHNSIVYLVDELNPHTEAILYKDLNLSFEKKLFSKLRRIDLATRIGSLTSPSFLKIKGSYAERKKFDWNKNYFNVYVLAKKIDLAKFQGYFSDLIKEPQINKIDGEFTGVIYLKKNKNDKVIKVASKTNTNSFLIEFQNKDTKQRIEIPKTDFLLKAFIEKNKIHLQRFKSHVDELTYELNGNILNWSKDLPEVDLKLKTNKFNFKAVKPYLPLALLPANTRSRIEPINDDGYVALDIELKGPLIAPKYFGTILLNDFNLTAESGFLYVIQGLEGKLVLDDEILKIDHLIIPVEGSPLLLKGEIDNKNSQTLFNLSGKDLAAKILVSLISQIAPQAPILNEIEAVGKLDLNLDVVSIPNVPPEIKGKLTFSNAGFTIFKDEPLEVRNVVGELLLDGAKVMFNKLSGLVNNESFFINGNFSLKEDEKLNLKLEATRLRIIPYLISFIFSKTPLKVVAKSISGEASNLDLNITGTFSNPDLDGMVLINNVSFNLPNFKDPINNINGSLRFENDELVIESLGGKVQNSDFEIAGYVDDLFSKLKPKLRLVTSDIEISSFWDYLKDTLKTTSLKAQAEALEKLSGLAALDLFIHPDVVLGNVYFKDGEIKYKSIPFDLKNLVGRLVIGEKNLSLFDLMGSINESNNFNCDLTVSNYLDPNFGIRGKLNLGLDVPSFLMAVNANALNTVAIKGLIPTLVNFDISLPIINLDFYSTLDDMLELKLDPYITKPINKSYTISGNVDFDTKDLNLYINRANINTNKLSLSLTGSIKDISSQNPKLMLYFITDEPSGIYMITEPITPLMDYKIFGMVELTGSVSGTPSNYSVSSNAIVTSLTVSNLFGKQLTASDGTFSVFADTMQGNLSVNVNNINYVSFNGKSLSLNASYANPLIYLNELSIDGNPGSIFAIGAFNPKDSSLSFEANGSDLELSSLGSFIFLDPSKISGMTNFSIMLEGSGKTKDEIISNSIGDLTFSVSDGKLGQVALLQKGIKFANIFKQGIAGFNLTNVFSLFFKYQDGSFNTIKGDLVLKKGVVKAKEFNYRAKDLFLNSFGVIDLVNSFVNLAFYGYLPERIGDGATGRQGSAISISPDAFGKKRFFIPFLASSPPQYFKFGVKGDIKNPKKITGHTRRSFKWLKGKRLKKEFKYVPKVED